jgi:hypothetical protein
MMQKRSPVLQALVGWAERRGLVDRPRPQVRAETVRQARYEVFREEARRYLQESVSATTSDLSWRSLARSERDLDDSLRRRMVSTAEWLDAGNPVAKAAMSLRTNLIVSEGFSPRPKTDVPQFAAEMEKWAFRWWDINDMDARMHERAKDAALLGEALFVRPAPNAVNGLWEAGLILPHHIESVESDPNNAERLIAVHLSDQARVMVGGRQTRTLRIARRHKLGEFEGRISGECFYLALNRRPGATRGVSDLLPVIDWLDQFDQMLYAQSERQRFINAFCWDITLRDATDEAIQRRADEIRASGPPRPGSLNIHSDGETWSAMAPDLKNADARDLMQYLFLLIWGGMGLPEHWFSSANSVNKASASVMDEPVWVAARERQRQWREHLQLMLDYAMQDVAEHVPEVGRIPAEERVMEVVSRDPDRTAWDVVGSALKGVGEALTVALASSLIDQSDAARVYCSIASALVNEDITAPSEDASDPMAEAKRRAADAYERAESRLREALLEAA